jgi:hypothetical protein
MDAFVDIHTPLLTDAVETLSRLTTLALSFSPGHRSVHPSIFAHVLVKAIFFKVLLVTGPPSATPVPTLVPGGGPLQDIAAPHDAPDLPLHSSTVLCSNTNVSLSLQTFGPNA